MKIKILPVLLFFLILLSCDSFAASATSFNGTGQQIIENTWDAGYISANTILGNENAYSQYLDIIDDMNYYPCVVISLENQSFYPRKIYTIYCGNSYTSQSNVPNGSFTISPQVKYVATIGNSGWVSSQSSYANFTSNQTFSVSSATQYRAYYWLYNGVWYQTLGSWYSSDYDLNNLRTDLEWDYASGYQTTTVSGFATNFYGYNRDYGVRFWELGTLSNYEDFPILNFKFYKIYSPLQQELVIDTNLYKSSFGWGTNNGTIALGSSGKVSVLSRNLNYSPYYMVIYALDDDLNVLSSCDAYFVFRKIGTVIPGTIGSGDYQGSGDYSSQDSTNDIIYNLTDTTEADSTLNNFFSGDSDSFAANLGYSPIENPFVSVISNTLQSMINIILGTGNVDLQIGFAHQTYTLHSQDFTLPNGSIKTFITLVCNGFLVWAIIKYGFMLYQWINSGRLQNLMNEANGHWYKCLF